MNSLNDMVDPKNYQKSFNDIAEYLLNSVELQTNSDTFEITELEFYFYSSLHEDPYVHCHNEQLKTDTFYVHQKNGNYGGIDITFGNERKKEFGGILIRGIKINDIYISGPNKVKKEICRSLSILDDYIELQKELNLEKIRLVQKSEKTNKLLYCSTRIGLKPNFKDFISKKNYIFNLLRYLIDDISSHGFKDKENVREYTNYLNDSNRIKF